MNQKTRILGIDPGSRTTGVGLVDTYGDRLVLVHWARIQTNGDHTSRLRQIFGEITKVVKLHCPDEIAIERVFVHRNADSALKLGQARAAALVATFDADLPVYEYAARYVKKSVAGQGNASKLQVQHMVKVLLGVSEEIQPDAADALAVALCHAHSRHAQTVIAKVAAQT